MFSRKPQTILSSKKMNEKVQSQKSFSLIESELTSPAVLHDDVVYISVGGVTMPLRK